MRFFGSARPGGLLAQKSSSKKVTFRSQKSNDRSVQNEKFFEKVLPAAKGNLRPTVQESAMKLPDRFTFDLSPFAFDRSTLLGSTSIFSSKSSSYKWWAKPLRLDAATLRAFRLTARTVRPFRHDASTVCPCRSISAWLHDRLPIWLDSAMKLSNPSQHFF